MLTARLAGTAPSSFALEGEATEADCVVDAWLTFETRGSVKLKSGVNIAQIKPKSVLLTDGTELEADLIVYATGYGSMNQWLADLISPEMADRLGKVWGLGSDTPKDPGPWEGELRNMWKSTHVPHLWVQGGNLHQNRHYSQFMGLQLKARYEGIPTPVYGQAQVHHLRLGQNLPGVWGADEGGPAPGGPLAQGRFNGGWALGTARADRLISCSSKLRKSSQPWLRAWCKASAKSQPLATRAAACRTASASPTLTLGMAHSRARACATFSAVKP